MSRIVLALVGAAAYFIFWPKPPRAAFTPQALDTGEQLVSTTGDPAEVVVTNVGERPMIVSVVAVTGANADEFSMASEECAGVIVERIGGCRAPPGRLWLARGGEVE